MVRVNIDSSSCQGHGRCYGQAPELIGADDQGYAVVPEGGALTDDVDLAGEVEDSCPEMAITVVSD